MQIRIVGTEIFVSQTRPFTNVDEFIEHLLQKLAAFYLESIASELSLLIEKETIHRKITTLWFSIRNQILYVLFH